MLHRFPIRIHLLRRDERLPAAPDRRRDHHRQHDAVLFKNLLHRDERRLRVQRIENRLHQNHVRAAGDQPANVVHVSRLHLIESDHAKTRIVRIRRIAQRHLHRPHRPRDEPLASRRVAHPIRPLATLPRRGLAHFPRQIVQEFVLDDLLEKLRILPPTVFPRVFHEKVAQRDRGHAKGIRLNDVRARLQKPPVDVADHLRLREREKVAAVQHVLLHILEALSPHIRLRHPISANRRSHRPVDDRDALAEQLFERMKRGHKREEIDASAHRAARNK